MAHAPVVTALHRYPVKSCRGLALTEAAVEPRGFAHDRRFMLVRPSDGRFLSQRQLPSMSQVVPAVNGSDLLLQRDGLAPLAIDIAAAADAGPRIEVEVWNWRGEGVDQGDAAAAWCSAAIGAPARLIFQPDDVRRPAGRHAPEANDIVSLADGYPYLLASTGSLASLVADVGKAVPMDRFRPSIVVDGAEAWAEEQWREVRIGQARFALVSDCKRCVIITTDQQTGERSREPLSTLARVRPAREGDGTGAIFARNMVPLELARICVGDEVEVVA